MKQIWRMQMQDCEFGVHNYVSKFYIILVYNKNILFNTGTMQNEKYKLKFLFFSCNNTFNIIYTEVIHFILIQLLYLFSKIKSKFKLLHNIVQRNVCMMMPIRLNTYV